MAKFQGQVITKQGSNLLARALAGEGKFIFTKAAFGNKKHTEHLEDITNLKSLKLNLNVVRIFNDDGNVVLTLHITNEHLNEGFLTNEFGIFAKLEGDREEILYSYAVAEEPDSIPANTFGTTYETTTEIYMNFASNIETDIHVREGAAFLTEPRANEIYVRNEYPVHGNLKSKTQLKADHIYFDDSGNFYLNTGGDRTWNNSATPDNKLIKITFKTIYKWITGIWSKLETKEPVISKKSGFNLDKSDEISLNSSETLATSKALMTVNNRKVNIVPTQKSANTHSTGLELSVGVAGTLPTGINHSTPIIINANYNTGYRNQLAMDYNGGCWIRGYNQSTRVETDWQKFWTTQDFDPSTKIDKTAMSSDTDSDSEETVATSLAVKKAYDKSVEAMGTKENAFDKNTAFNKNFGTTAGTVLEGDKIEQITGQTYGGILNVEGEKTAGLTYFDNNTKKLFLCKNNNSDISANVANYIALDNSSLLDRLENLPGTILFSGYANINKSFYIPMKLKRKIRVYSTNSTTNKSTSLYGMKQNYEGEITNNLKLKLCENECEVKVTFFTKDVKEEEFILFEIKVLISDYSADNFVIIESF